MNQAALKMEPTPDYIDKIREVMSEKKVYPLKDLFMEIRKDYPDVVSMRHLKKDIEKYIKDYQVNNNNLVICKQSLLTDILSIIKD